MRLLLPALALMLLSGAMFSGAPADAQGCRWGGDCGGGMRSSVAPPIPSGAPESNLTFQTLIRGIEDGLYIRREWSPLGGDTGISQASVTQATANTACNVAFPDTSAMYLISDGNGACAGGGAILQLCGCRITSAVAGALFPLSVGGPGNFPTTVWRHFFSGTDPGTAGLFSYGVPDWVGPWFEFGFGLVPGSASQEQWVPHTGRNGDPYMPISGHTMAMVLRVSLSNLDTDDRDATIAAWCFVEDGNTDILLDPAATTAAGAIKGITNGMCLMWYGFKFHSVSVRAGSENIREVLDLTNKTQRDNWSTSKRSLIDFIQVYDMNAPAQNASISYQRAAYKLGLQPFTAYNVGNNLSVSSNLTSWQLAYDVSGANNSLQVPSGTPAGGYVGLIPVVAVAASSTSAWAGTTSYVIGQRVTNGGVTYVAAVAHISSASFANDLSGAGACSPAACWISNEVQNADVGVGDAYMGKMALVVIEHGS